jgi:hypothetical protein
MRTTLLWILLFSLPAHSWDERQRTVLSDLSVVHKAYLTDSAFSTFWGGMRRAVFWALQRGEVQKLRVKGFQKPLPLYISFLGGRKDLIIYYPGVFGKVDGRISPHMINTLEKKDAHVAVIPNIIAGPYLLARPQGEGDALKQETTLQTAVFDEVIKLVGSHRLKKIHIVAESLGSYQAMILQRPVASVTLLWPPLHLARSIRRFDELIQRSRPFLENQCALWWKWPWYFFEVKLKNLPDTLKESDKTCLGAWVLGEGFVGAIKKTSESIKELRGIGEKLPENFSEFIQVFLPEFYLDLKKEDQRFSISYLLKTSPTPKESFRFISSRDDFLNIPEEWEELSQDFPGLSGRIFLFEKGGHSGPLGITGLSDIITSP